MSNVEILNKIRSLNGNVCKFSTNEDYVEVCVGLLNITHGNVIFESQYKIAVADVSRKPDIEMDTLLLGSNELRSLIQKCKENFKNVFGFDSNILERFYFSNMLLDLYEKVSF